VENEKEGGPYRKDVFTASKRKITMGQRPRDGKKKVSAAKNPKGQETKKEKRFDGNQGVKNGDRPSIKRKKRGKRKLGGHTSKAKEKREPPRSGDRGRKLKKKRKVMQETAIVGDFQKETTSHLPVITTPKTERGRAKPPRKEVHRAQSNREGQDPARFSPQGREVGEGVRTGETKC